MMTEAEIRKQSDRAYKQWATQWRENAKIHSKYPMKPITEFEYSGCGKAVLCVANGYSLEQEIDTIKKYQDHVDIVCCDKSLGHLLDHGIKPKFCLVADANVSFSKYLDKWKDQLQDTILFVNVCANPEWTAKGNWKEKYFYVVMDVNKNEVEFSAISGCKTIMAAGTNVSNSLVILLTQCDNSGRKNFFAYDKILLIGFDYSWMSQGKYYAFEDDGSGKKHYMQHLYLLNANRDYVYASGNLLFSARWLETYINAYKLPVIQCSKNGIFATKQMGVLSEQMQYSFRKEDGKKVSDLFKLRTMLIEKKRDIEHQLAEIAKDHYYSFLASV
jgi:hypothetical protein